MNNFLKWQNQDGSNKNRILALLIGALIFPITIPVLLVVVLPHADNYFGIGSLFYGLGNIIIGIMAIIIGGIVAIWTIVIQITLASGTPFPMFPTKKLLIVGPFKYCRNPMTLGTIAAYGGIAILIGSFTALLAVAIFSAILLGYLKIIEEKELQMRFGSEYMEYKKKTPFIIPIKIGRTDSKKLASEHYWGCPTPAPPDVPSAVSPPVSDSVIPNLFMNIKILKISLLAGAILFFFMALAHLFGLRIPGLYIYYNLNSLNFQDKIISALSFGWSIYFYTAFKLPHKLLLKAILFSGIIAIVILAYINYNEDIEVNVFAKIEVFILFLYWLWLVFLKTIFTNKKML